MALFDNLSSEMRRITAKLLAPIARYMSEQNDISGGSYWKLIPVVVVALGLLLILTVFVVAFAPFETSVSITLVGTIASTVLSAILAYFYLTMRDIQQQQARITDSQNEIARAAQEPRILIQEWRVVENEVCATISNIGDGIATDISMTFCIRPVDVKESYELVSYIPIKDHRDPLEKEFSKKNYISSNILEPGEKSTVFKSEIRLVNCFITDDEPESLKPPSYIFRRLNLKNPDHVLVSVVISYDDILQSTHHSTIWEAVVKYSDEDSIELFLTKDVYDLGRDEINLIRPDNAPKKYNSSKDGLLYE